MNMEPSPTNSYRELKWTLISFLGYGLFYGISQVFGNATIPITFYIPELSKSVTVAVPIESWLSMFVTGAAFAILAMKIFIELYHSERSSIMVHVSPKNMNVIDGLFIFSVASYVLFNAVHEVIKFVGYMIDQLPVDVSSSPFATLYNYVYFYHEYFGHLFSIPLMIIFTIFAFGFLHEPPTRKLKWYAWLFLCAIGLGFGATWVEGWAEGECQVINAIYDLGLVIAIAIIFHKNRMKLTAHPLFCVLVVEALVFMAGVVIWGFLYGLLPYYPFFKEPP